MTNSLNNKMLGEALYWIRVTERQMDRFVDSLISVAETHVKDAMSALADGHFLLISAAQAEPNAQSCRSSYGSKVSFNA